MGTVCCRSTTLNRYGPVPSSLSPLCWQLPDTPAPLAHIPQLKTARRRQIICLTVCPSPWPCSWDWERCSHRWQRVPPMLLLAVLGARLAVCPSQWHAAVLGWLQAALLREFWGMSLPGRSWEGFSLLKKANGFAVAGVGTRGDPVPWCSRLGTAGLVFQAALGQLLVCQQGRAFHRGHHH